MCHSDTDIRCLRTNCSFMDAGYSVRLYLQLFVGGIMSYLRYLYLFAYSGVLHILCCVFVPRVYPRLPVSLDCPFLIAPLSFSNMYQVHTRSYTHLSLLLLLLLYHYFCDLIDLLCLTPLSAIFQLYHGDQF